MQKWEYLEVKLNKPYVVAINGENLPKEEGLPNQYEYLNQLGAQGWEIIDVKWADFGDLSRILFKRLKVD